MTLRLYIPSIPTVMNQSRLVRLAHHIMNTMIVLAPQLKIVSNTQLIRRTLPTCSDMPNTFFVAHPVCALQLRRRTSSFCIRSCNTAGVHLYITTETKTMPHHDTPLLKPRRSPAPPDSIFNATRRMHICERH